MWKETNKVAKESFAQAVAGAEKLSPSRHCYHSVFADKMARQTIPRTRFRFTERAQSNRIHLIHNSRLCHSVAVCSSNGRLPATFCQVTSCLYGRTAAVSTRRLFSEDPHSLSRLQDAPWPSGETRNGRESCSGFISPLCHGKTEKTIHLNLSFLERKK